MKLDLQKKIPGYSHFYVCNNMLSFDKEKLPTESIPVNDPIRLIYIGRLSPEKGILDFIEVFNRLKNKNQFSLTILGDGLIGCEFANDLAAHGLHLLCHDRDGR